MSRVVGFAGQREIRLAVHNQLRDGAALFEVGIIDDLG